MLFPHIKSIIALPFLAIMLFSSALAVAQEEDWFDSLQVKEMKQHQREEQRQACWKKFINKEDTTKFYEPSAAVGMVNRFTENPGFCGFEQRPTVQCGVRFLYPDYEFDQRTYQPYEYFFGYDGGSGGRRRWGWGAMFSHSQSGQRTSSRLDQSISYKIRLSRHNFLRIGVTLQYFQSGLNWYNLLETSVLVDQGHGLGRMEPPPGEGTKKTLNFSTGLVFSRKHFYAGLGIQNLTRPDYGFIGQCRMSRIWTFSSGYTLPVNAEFEISGSLQFRFSGIDKTLNIHLSSLCFKHLIAGISLTENKTFSAELGYSLHGRLMIFGSCGISSDKELTQHFGPLYYVSG